jgi:uncharacterized membrane protein
MILPIFLDGPTVGGMLGLGLIFIVIPVIALILLIYFFNKWRKKRNEQ